jgi:hypothetical protein
MYLQTLFFRSKKVWLEWPVEHVALWVTSHEQWRRNTVFELRKKEEVAELPKVLDDFQDPYLSKKWPCIASTVFCCTFKDGSYRQPGSFTCWRGPEGVTVKVVDNELDCAWQHTSDSFEKALNVIEKQLTEGKVANRSNFSRGAPRKRKK